MKVSQRFIDAKVVQDDTALTADVLEHLGGHLPEVLKAYPHGYLVALVRHSATFARDHFGLDELAAIRLFVRLRWEIVPGFYKEPSIAAALADRQRRPMERFESLLTAEMEHVWLDATQYDGPAYWRGQYSDGFGDLHYADEDEGIA